MNNNIAETMKKLLESQNRTRVWYGDLDLIEQCAKLNGLHFHPQKSISTVLNALEQSPDFNKSYIYSDINGRQRKYRCFSLINN